MKEFRIRWELEVDAIDLADAFGKVKALTRPPHAAITVTAPDGEVYRCDLVVDRIAQVPPIQVYMAAMTVASRAIVREQEPRVSNVSCDLSSLEATSE